MDSANIAPDNTNKNIKGSYLIIKKTSGDHFVLRYNSEKFVYCTTAAAKNRRKHVVPYFVALKDKNNDPHVVEVVGRARKSNEAKALIESLKKQLKDEITDSASSEICENDTTSDSMKLINVFLLVILSSFITGLATVVNFYPRQPTAENQTNTYPDELLGVWKMTTKGPEMRKYYLSNVAKQNIREDYFKYLGSDAVPMISFEKGRAPGQIIMKRVWAGNVIESDFITLNESFFYRTLHNGLFLVSKLFICIIRLECRDEHESVDALGPEAAPTTTHPSYLALVPDMTTKTLIDTIRKFIARMGCPKAFYSDNAKQFIAASQSLDLFWSTLNHNPDFTNYVNSNGIEWKFIIERAPWQGGLYERMVKCVKEPLKCVIGRSILYIAELDLLFAEVEGIVNCRPLTYMETEDNIVLRPIDFVRPGAQLGVPHVSFDDDSDYFDHPPTGPEGLYEDFKSTTRRLDKFWTLFRRRYLNELKSSLPFDHHQPRSVVRRVPIPGEMVIVNLDNTVRAEWPLARIKKLITSHDGQCRAAEVLLPSGRCLTRPINLLIPLEVHFASRECRDEHESVDALGPEAAPTTTHPSCLAVTADTTTATMTPDTGLSDDATSSSRTTDTLNPPQGYTQRPPRCSHRAGHTADYGSTR